MPEKETPAPTMSKEETEEYRTEMSKELADLELAQYIWPSDYKAERIARLQQRLGIHVP